MLLSDHLAMRLRCPSCAGGGWEEHAYSEDPGSGAIACSDCGRRWLVVAGVPLMTTPVGVAGSHRTLLEHLDADAGARHLVGASFGRFQALLGGVPGVLAHLNDRSLEGAFEVPGAPWISLARFEWSKFAHLRDLAPEGECLVDLGCGYGPSSAPFLASGRVRTAIGVDENLYFLLLFKRYAQEKELGELGLVCHDVGRTPLPIGDGSANVLVASSFFNHFACLKSSRALRGFFGELSRLSPPGGTLLLDMVPNRRHPFATEVNLGEVISQPRLRGAAQRVLRNLPLRWLPGRLTVAALWCGYRLYMAAGRRRALGLAAFKREVGKAIPESAVGGLPLRLRSHQRLVEGFSRVELFDEGVLARQGRLQPVSGAALGIPYFILRATR